MAWIDRDVDGDTWAGTCGVDENGPWEFTIAAWTDVWGTWRDELRRKALAANPISWRAVRGGRRPGRGPGAGEGRRQAAHRPRLRELDAAHRPRPRRSTGRPPGRSSTPPSSAHRSATARPGSSGRCRSRSTVRWPASAPGMSFPPLLGRLPRRGRGHPGPGRPRLRHPLPAARPPHRAHEPQGPQQHPDRRPRRPRQPWAIGGPEGGHTALHPDLGTIEDFDHLVSAAKTHGVEIALDFAIQCSPDHPWVERAP